MKQNKTERSPSPSALSTASSGSPLVRDTSPRSSAKSFTFSISDETTSTSVRRPPAPTSIAAAQLNQLEQQQKKISNNKQQKIKNGNKLAHIMMASKQIYDDDDDHVSQKKLDADNLKDSERSSGYNFGKLLAYRANRFGEFWSANKMRYLNLACLLMTLVCLLTILLFGKTSPSPVEERLTTIEQPVVEHLELLGKQALTGASGGQPAAASSSSSNSNDDAMSTDGFQVFDERLPSSSKRDLSASAASQAGEREAEPELARPPRQQQHAIESSASDIFDDLDGPFGLMRLFRSQLNASSGSALDPIVRRSKNGATIVISGGSFGPTTATGGGSNESELAQALPAILERLLPAAFVGLRGGQPILAGAESGRPARIGATITIQSEPQLITSESGSLFRSAPIFAPMPSGNLLGMLLKSRLSEETSRQTNQTEPISLASRRTSSTNSSSSNQTEPEIEMVDVRHLPRALPFPFPFPFPMPFHQASSSSRPSQSGSMLLLSSSQPQIMMHRMRMPSLFSPLQAAEPFPAAPTFLSSPFLRSLLAGEPLSSEQNEQQQQQQQPHQAERADKTIAPRRDQEVTTADDWDELAASSNSRSRHLAGPQQEEQQVSSRGEQEDGELGGEPGNLFERLFNSLNAPHHHQHQLEEGPFRSRTMFSPTATIRQTITRPGVTIERVIGLPRTSSIAAQIQRRNEPNQEGGQQQQQVVAQQVGAGIRSQSLSRMLDEEDAASDNDPTSSLFGRLFSSATGSEHRRSDDAARPFFMSPFGVFSGHNHPQHFRAARQMMLAEQEADQAPSSEQQDEEADELSNKFRVGRLRVSATRRHDSMMPSRVSISSDSRQDAANKQQLEDRLNQAISQAATTPTAGGRTAAEVELMPSSDLTSPSSPLFGFPAAVRSDAAAAAAQQRQKQSPKPFVYHSNHEIAKPQQAAKEAQHHHQSQHQARSADESQSPPAAIVMGRRLDDGPFSSNEPQQQPLSFRSMNNARQLHKPVSLDAAAEPLNSADNQQQASEFRTIVV